MKTPQIVWISLQSIAIVGSSYQFGKDKFTAGFIARILVISANNAILNWGGFFS